MSVTTTVARVYLLDVPYHVDKPYDYFIPEELRCQVAVGGFVCVPFGGSNKKQLALVCELSSASDYTKLKSIVAVVCGSVCLDSETIGLCFYMKEHFLCSIGEAVKTVLPSSVLTRVKEYYCPTDKIPKGELSPRLTEIYKYAAVKGNADREELASRFGTEVHSALSKLIFDGYIECKAVFTDSRVPASERVALSDMLCGKEKSEVLSLVRGEKQKELLEVLFMQGTCDMSELCREYEISRQTVMSLQKKGILKIERLDAYRIPYSRAEGNSEMNIVLSPEQAKARDEILKLCRLGEPKAALLHGVTGSGKTKVIQAVMAEVTASGKQAIMLVPEIALTPQTVGIFRAQYGDRVAVIHSGLSKGERFDAWRRISSGKADVCIGTRSAVFAPMKNLGLIVLDEEQEHTYKSDQNPKYHARDIARYRCAKSGATMLLASATPSLDSFKKAREGKYSLITLKNRYGNAELPTAVITDSRIDLRSGNTSPVGAELRKRIKDVLSRREQAILFINQRGYNRFLSCPLCGQVITCRSCSVSYTYHAAERGEGGYLYCHYCGGKEAVPRHCPKCGNNSLSYVGYGTQYVEKELNRLFPDAAVMRMDADTTSTKFSYENLLSRFREGEADILIGTQMVTKGHDFPRVTLVGVINADTSLYISDYKANERTFDLLAQVIGRSGRADKKGCALIQTSNPEHPILELSARQDYEKMYENEIALRRSLLFPPFCDMLMFTASSEDERGLMEAVKQLSDMLRKALDGEPKVAAIVFGPMEAPVYKVGGIFRMRIIVKCKWNVDTRRLISEVYSEISRRVKHRITVSVDVNPSSL